MNSIVKFLGSGFYSGYIKYASGTWGSLAALLIYLIPGFEKPVVLIPAIFVFIIIGIPIGNIFEKEYGKDPSECTIDEIVGMWISLLFLPKESVIIIITFFLWRILDIIKPPPARQFEAFKGGVGIMSDDIMSGIYTCLIMNLIIIKIF